MSANLEVVAGRFRLLDPLGKGNMGEVHRAEDLLADDDSANREVAVKRILRNRSGVLIDTHADMKARQRFDREVRIMRMLDHPNLPHVIAGGVDDSGLPYLAMELLDGRSLGDLVAEHSQLPVSWVAALGAQIANGLAAAHNAGVVHRDLKPSNVMVLHGGLVKVLDFGMGRIIGDVDGRVTSSGVTVGTARYMAPEQFRASAVGQAADLYALGCVLFELLTGVPPFHSESTHELGEKHLHDEVPTVRLLRQDVPDDLDRLIRRLLAKEPADRPVDAVAVREALLPLAAGEESVSGWADFDPVARLTEKPAEETAAPVSTSVAPPAPGMDVFAVHRKLIEDYRAFTEGGTIIRDDRIEGFVRDDLDAKSQWPDPWLSLNPFFASGGTVLELTRDGVLHDECARIFQSEKTPGGTMCNGRPLTLHRHQLEAVRVAQSGASYVLTTGTGSGKSLAYLVPIVDKVLRDRQRDGSRRVRAIIVYPMNALANSQLKELDKFLLDGYGKGNEPVTYARYTGQENEERRKEIRDNPPDILLTNYVMLELMLTRPDDRRSLIKMAKGLEFLVFDELHTYRGRQGADVALLIRRVREACQAERLQCVGTSATMSSEDTFEERRKIVADVASTLFGTTVRKDDVIGETLTRATKETPDAVQVERLRTPDAPRAYDDLVTDPLARWIETRFGLTTDESGRLVRQQPAKIEEAADELAEQSGLDADVCAAAIRDALKAGSEARNPVTGRPLFAFRLHQFLSKGDTVYVTLEDTDTRHLTRDYQRFLPGSDGKILLPLAFCRECGQEYHTVWRREKDGTIGYEPRRDTAATGGRAGDGYLYLDPDRPWPRTAEEAIEDRRLPESWLELDDHGHESVRDSYQRRLPTAVTVDPYGIESEDGLAAAFIPAPFLFCLHCGVSYEQVRGKDFAKLATLDQEGRSSATSLVSASIVRSLKEAPPGALDKKARKLLTFVDNRQDASLQAGHFNDFVQITQLRGALYRATVEAGEDGIRHEELAARVAGALGLTPADYATNPDLAPALARIAAKTLQDVIAFRLYLDLQRGWRVTMPNLEQTGLLEIRYEDLDWLAGSEDRWRDTHPTVRDAEPGRRAEIMRVLLDEMRRALAVDVQHFRDDFDTLQRASEERLTGPWVLSASDRPQVGTAYPQGSKPGMDRSGLYLSGRGKFGKYLRRVHVPGLPHDEAQQVIEDLLTVLADAGLVQRIEAVQQRSGRPRRSRGPTVTGYRVSARTLIWRAGTGETGVHDPLTRTYASGEGPRVNVFFRDLYRSTAGTLGGLAAMEHTAQVDPRQRELREEAFRRGDLRLLYCSPTMELGVDISELNAVMMRNVPPTPANYAQRSGRAGRSGQPALVTTYCATGNSHDQYYFRRSERMVAGIISRPRLDLANEDLVRSHVQAIWLAESGLKLGHAIPQIIDIGYAEDARVPDPKLPLHDHVLAALRDPDAPRRAVIAAKQVLDGLRPDFADTTWWHDQWLADTVRVAGTEFDRGFGRWRRLFRAALVDQAEQNRRVLDHTLSERDRNIAVGRRREAETQLTLLKNESVDSESVLSDFNPYRYLASEGFLPGYSFPRLPLAAYIPTSARRFGDGDYLQRPRFLAIREFGPGALIYHEGARYQVTRIQLPPDTAGDVVTTEARRCPACGYHHSTQDKADKCEFCKEPLRDRTSGLLRLHTVYTRRRERISSDEEERRRAGFRLVTSYRFHDHGDRPGQRDARVSDEHGPIATVTYGDSATVRISNIGRVVEPSIAEIAGTARRTRIAEWTRENPESGARYQAERRKQKSTFLFASSSNVFPLCAKGLTVKGVNSLQTDQLFAERFATIVAPQGRIGCIVPTAIATGAAAQHLFGDFTQRSVIVTLFDFENRNRIFDNVHASYKFCLLSLGGREIREPEANFAFFLADTVDLDDIDRTFSLAAEEITAINPNTGTLPIFRTRRDADLTATIYRRLPVLWNEKEKNGNRWLVVFKRLSDMTDDSDLFRTRERLESEGWRLDGNIFIRDDERMLPLYEAKMIHHFDHRWNTYHGPADEDRHRLSPTEKQNPATAADPRYWIAESGRIPTVRRNNEVEIPGVAERLVALSWDRDWLCGWRDVCRATDERTAIPAFFPRTAAGHTLPLMLPRVSPPLVAALVATQSSLVFDFVSRQKVGGIHMALMTWKQLPVPAPDTMEPHTSFITPRVLELVYTAYDMAGLAKDLGDDGQPFRWDEERRALIRAELDAYFFHLYGIDRDDTDYILESFQSDSGGGLKHNEIAKYGTYRTKDLVLAEYDRMADAGLSLTDPLVDGENYSSTLTPPPGHGPRHPAPS